MRRLFEQVHQTVRTRRLLQPRQAVVLAVSGGVDSMVLLHALAQGARRERWRLVVAHLNHQLRGAASDADQALVEAAARALSLPCVAERADVRAHALARHLSLETAARELRHACLARVAHRFGCVTIALGHHADDQLETFFLRLLRGSASEGLGGMRFAAPSPADPKLTLIRPLLDQPKSALRACARSEGIPCREDASNRRTDFRRNRIRHELIPLLRDRFQPALHRTVLRAMDVLALEQECVDDLARAWLGRKRPARFDGLAPAVQRRVLLRQLLALDIEPAFDPIERLRLEPYRALMPRPHTQVWRDALGRLHRGEVRPAAFDPHARVVDLGAGAGTAELGGVHLRWQIEEHRPTDALLAAKPADCEYFDADLLGLTLCVRHWQPGDRFQPIGLSRAAKLQDLFTNAKIPSSQRRRLLLGTTHLGEVFWVEGLRIGERFKLGDRTQRRLRWAWARATAPA